LPKLSDNCLNELLSPLRKAHKLAVVCRVSREKADILFSTRLSGQAGNTHQIATVIAEQQQRVKGGLISRLHSEGPLAVVKNLGTLHLQD
jgi:hypothetical protein